MEIERRSVILQPIHRGSDDLASVDFAFPYFGQIPWMNEFCETEPDPVPLRQSVHVGGAYEIETLHNRACRVRRGGGKLTAIVV